MHNDWKNVVRVLVLSCLSASQLALGDPAGEAPTLPSGPPVLSTIPLCSGLQIVTAVSQSDGDYESIKTIESVSEAGVRIKYSSERMVSDWLSPGPPKLQKTNIYRTVRREDLRSATLYQQQYSELVPETIPQTTAIGTSSDVLNALKTKGETEFGIFIAYSGEASIDREVHPNVYDNQMIAKIERVGTEPVILPVIVNDTPAVLPAIHAKGDFFGDKSEFFFLDDPKNPLTLKFRIGIGAIQPMAPEMRELCKSVPADVSAMFDDSCGSPEGGDKEVLQVVKISYRCGEAADAARAGSGPPSSGGEGPGMGDLSGSAAALEESLAKTGKVEVYDIYFSFNSAEIRKESEPRLEEIAAVMQKHPDWKLSVGGHTDSIGSDDDNLTLSQRRAAAVKDVLLNRYGIAAERLVTAGYGESQPKDTNETLEGRARNRRVELVKL